MNIIANCTKLFMVFVGVSGCYSVLFGAWLAHGGQMLMIDEKTRLATALQYQFCHTLALAITLLCYHITQQRRLLFAALGFTLGILCFSGSLYVKTLLGIAFISKLAPLGGILLAVSWLIFGLCAATSFHHNSGTDTK